jgi:hypothetical protein
MRIAPVIAALAVFAVLSWIWATLLFFVMLAAPPAVFYSAMVVALILTVHPSRLAYRWASRWLR